MRRRKLSMLVALAAVAIAVLLVARLWPAASSTAATAPGATAAASAPAVRAGSAAAPAALPSDLAELVAYLRARFGKNIANSYVQIQMLEKLMHHFQARNAAGWQAELLAAIRAAFPERYAEIAANLQHRLDYEAWLKSNTERLRGLGERERREALWEERARLFGEEAAGEIWASERKNQALTDALAAIDARPDATVGDRLAQYKESLQETHQENAETFLENHRQEALHRFLALDSVQRELSSLSPADRAAVLRDVRQGLGLDDEALGRWDALDHERDLRWEVGRTYMAERAALAKQYSGEPLATHLQELRSRYFGAEAATIADEEASGFFRFDQPRRYGLN
ncbi:MAG TPA: hypothetical protein VN253_17920 [Kofleriaceae bacterium]|nr:hypothetical protein [Kofleriaceae bacterium]